VRTKSVSTAPGNFPPDSKRYDGRGHNRFAITPRATRSEFVYGLCTGPERDKQASPDIVAAGVTA
jgi:hypothetical protein